MAVLVAPLAMRAARPTGCRRWGLAFLAGALTTLAFSPFNFVPVLLVSFTCLVWQIDTASEARKPLRSAAALGWWFGFGYHLAGIHWIGFAFMVDAGAHAWMIPFVALAMPGGLALFTALAALLSRALFDQATGPERIIGFAVLWVLMEWLRGTILTGFPWNLAGYTWVSVLPVAQAASVIGIYGLTLLTVLLACAPAGLARWSGGRFVADPRGSTYLAGSLGLLAVLAVWGGQRLGGANDAMADGVYLRIVQPSIPQREKWKPGNSNPIFQEYLQYTSAGDGETEAQSEPVTHVIWPESAIPFLIDRQPGALEAIGRTLSPGQVLLTGAARVTPGAGPGDPVQYFNAVHVIDAAGRIAATYDKYHLVPFGEYLPLSGVLERMGFEQMARSAGGFSSGPGPRTLEVPGAGNVMPLICYEAIFPGRISQAASRPDWLLNVTNDAWFGTTTGPHQHFTQSRFRAIEEGLPLVRSANTGISGIIDGHGRVIALLGLGQRGVVEGPLPTALPATFYAVWGDWSFWALMVLGSLWLGFLRSRMHP